MTERLKKEIWVYGDLRNERLFGLGLNVLAKARELALSVEGKVAVILMGSSAEPAQASLPEGPMPINAASETCISHGADLVYILTHKKLTMPRADIYAPPSPQLVVKSGHCSFSFLSRTLVANWQPGPQASTGPV